MMKIFYAIGAKLWHLSFLEEEVIRIWVQQDQMGTASTGTDAGIEVPMQLWFGEMSKLLGIHLCETMRRSEAEHCFNCSLVPSNSRRERKSSPWEKEMETF
jgi:hypothetical protein